MNILKAIGKALIAIPLFLIFAVIMLGGWLLSLINELWWKIWGS